MPKSAAEIETAAKAGDLPETPTFDAKGDLPQPSKNADLAIDVAAMATDGGTLLYGVAEDTNKHPTIPNPIPLAGAGDRIGNIVATSIAEVPYIKVDEFRCDDDDTKGYIVVTVPPSPRAPHQVTVGGDLRFYGRGAKGNRRLTEGEVARLYERRQAWKVSAEEVLGEVIAGSEIPPQEGVGYLHAFTRPIPLDQGMFERALAQFETRSELQLALYAAVDGTKLRTRYGPSLDHANYFDRRGADEWRLSSVSENERTDPQRVGNLTEARFNIDGRAQLFCGRATDTVLHDPDTPFIIEAVIAGNLEAFLATASVIYSAADFLGPVDVGVAVTGIKGAYSYVRSKNWRAGDFRYTADDTFRRTTRLTAAAELEKPDEVAHRLLRPFYEATTGQEGYNPFENPDALGR